MRASNLARDRAARRLAASSFGLFQRCLRMPATALSTGPAGVTAGRRSGLCRRAPFLFLPTAPWQARRPRAREGRSRKAAAAGGPRRGALARRGPRRRGHSEIGRGLASRDSSVPKATISKTGTVKRGSGKAAVPVGDARPCRTSAARRRRRPAPEIAAARLPAPTKKRMRLTADIREVRGPPDRQRGARRRGRRASNDRRSARQPAWVTYKDAGPGQKEAPKKYEGPRNRPSRSPPKKDDALRSRRRATSSRPSPRKVRRERRGARPFRVHAV